MVDFALSLAKWCRRHGVVDSTFYSADRPGTAYTWDYTDPERPIVRMEGRPAERYIPDHDFLMEGLRLRGHNTDGAICMCTEGELNYAIHYGMRERLLDAFLRFLRSRGYGLCRCGNCYNIIYKEAGNGTSNDQG